MKQLNTPAGPHDQKLCLRITAQTRARLDRLAERYGITRTAVVEAAVGHLVESLAGKLKERDDA